MSETDCRKCGSTVDIQADRWFQYQWEERPSKEQVETAIEDKEFRDWFQENHVLCPVCHESVQQLIAGNNDQDN